MKKQIKPIAAASVLAFGIAPLSAGAIEYNEVQDQYPALTGWSESDWNSYLEDNYGTSLSDYTTTGDLEADIGEPIDVDMIGNTDTEDPNILDIMEKYNLNTDELVSFLAAYDNRDNIHFVGDLENALQDSGQTPVNEGSGNDQETTGDSDNEQTTVTDQSTSESGNDQVNSGDSTSDQATSDESGIDQSELEETYLVPLGWSVDEFNRYLDDTYDMNLNDFNLFEDLEATVGPVLTDENEQELIGEYDLTHDEYVGLLNEYGETPEDYDFLYDLDDSLEYYTSEQPSQAETEQGAEMPDTASSSVAYIIMGMGAVMLGGFMLKGRRKYGEH